MDTKTTVGNAINLRLMIFFLISGTIISVPLTLFIDSYAETICVPFPGFLGFFCAGVLFTPFIEEFAKAYPLFYRYSISRRALFVYGFLGGLGFGIMEFYLYVVHLGVPVILRLPGVFFHGASTSITAYGIGVKRQGHYYLVAMSLHFLNNFFVVWGIPWILISFVVTGVTYVVSLLLYRRTHVTPVSIQLK